MTNEQAEQLNRAKTVEEMISVFEMHFGELPFNTEVLVRKAWNKGWEKGAIAGREIMLT